MTESGGGGMRGRAIRGELSGPGKPAHGEGSPEWSLPAAAHPSASYQLVIHGSPPSKNDNRAVTLGGRYCTACKRKSGGRATIINGDRTREWKRQAYAELRAQWAGRRPIEADVRLSGVVYWRTRASDLAVEVIQDVLQGEIVKGARRHVGIVIADDRQVMEYGAWFRRFDSKRPRVELLVEVIGAEQGGLQL